MCLKNKLVVLLCVLAIISALVFFRFLVQMREKTIYYAVKNEIGSPCLSYIITLKAQPKNLEEVIKKGFLAREKVKPIRDGKYQIIGNNKISFKYHNEGGMVIITPDTELYGIIKSDSIILNSKN